MTPANRLTGLLDTLRAEFTANLRLRLGTWCVLLLVLVYWILVRADDLQAARTDYGAEVDRLERAQNASADEDWPSLLAAEEATARELLANFWQAQTEGEAQARLFAALTELADEVDLRDVRVQAGVTQPVADVTGVWRVQARLTARHRDGAELRLLYGLATHPKKFVADRLDLNQSRRRLTLLVSAYFTLEAESTESTEST